MNLPYAITRDASIPTTYHRVLSVVLSHLDADGHALSHRKIAEESGYSIRTVIRATGWLVQRDLLTARPRFHPGRRDRAANHYWPGPVVLGEVSADSALTAESDTGGGDTAVTRVVTQSHEGGDTAVTARRKVLKESLEGKNPPTPHEARPADTKDGGEDLSEEQRDSETAAEAERAAAGLPSRRLEERHKERDGAGLDGWSGADCSTVGLSEAELRSWLEDSGDEVRSPVAVLRSRLRRDGLEDVLAEVTAWREEQDLAGYADDAAAWQALAMSGPPGTRPRVRRLSFFSGGWWFDDNGEEDRKSQGLLRVRTYAGARRRGLSAEEIAARTLALPGDYRGDQLEPDGIKWLASQMPETIAEDVSTDRPLPAEPRELGYGKPQAARSGTEDR